MSHQKHHEKISIRNFLVIKAAEIDIKPFNIIIGPQAHGKSLVAKLLSVFNGISQDFIESIRLNENKRAFDRRFIAKFVIIQCN